MRRIRQRGMAGMLVLAISVILAQSARAQGQPVRLPISAIWRQGGFWIPVRDAAQMLAFQVEYRSQSQTVLLSRGGQQVQASVSDGSAWESADGRLFVPVHRLDELGYPVRPGSNPNHAIIGWDSQQGYLERAPRSIAVNLQRQVLSALEGDVLVYRFRVSTGKEGYNTPSGDYQVRAKELLHISTKYPKPRGGARMPNSLWIGGGYYIHGYQIVPRHPASHGCIRLTIPDARTLFQWTPIGAPVRIYRTQEL